MPHSSQSTHSKRPKAPRKKRIRSILQTRPQSSTPNTEPDLENASLTGAECRILGHLQAIPESQTFIVEIVSHPSRRKIGAMEHMAKKTQKVTTFAPDETVSRITIGEPTLPCSTGSDKTVPKIQSTKPNTRSMRNGRNQNATMNSMRSPRLTRNPRNSTLIAGRNPSRNSNIGSGGGRNQRRNVNLG